MVPIRVPTLQKPSPWHPFTHLRTKQIVPSMYRTGGGKFWRIWRMVYNSPNFSVPIVINTVK